MYITLVPDGVDCSGTIAFGNGSIAGNKPFCFVAASEPIRLGAETAVWIGEVIGCRYGWYLPGGVAPVGITTGIGRIGAMEPL